jgi:diguanylate cyclase (GGDEF)-like protein/PAS domain S-box-containing protein
MQYSIERKIVLTFSFVATLILFGSWLALQNSPRASTMTGATRNVNRNLYVLQQSSDSLSRAELASQAYQLTGDTWFDTLHIQALDELAARLQSYAKLSGTRGSRSSTDVHNMDVPDIRRMIAAYGADESDHLTQQSADWELRNVKFNATVLIVSSVALVLMVGALSAVLVRDIGFRRKRDRAEVEAQMRLKHVMETLPSVFLSVDDQFRITYANKLATNILGLDKNDILGRSLPKVLPVSLEEALKEPCTHVLATGNPAVLEAHDTDGDRWFAVEVNRSPYGISLHMRDITTTKRAVETQERLLALLEATPDVIGINDVRGKCYFNRAGRELFGIVDEEDTSCPVDADDIEEEVSRLQDEVFPIGLERGIWESEKMIRIKDGSRIPVSQVAIAHRDRTGGVAFVSTIMRDISERKRAELQLQNQMHLIEKYSHELEEANAMLKALATTDGLTGLQNHRSFQERLSEEFQRSMRYGSPISLLMLDVDSFKEYNDTYGHPAGDQVLKQMATILREASRATDVVARYGGEEFVAILSETDAEGAVDAAERIRKAVEAHQWEGRQVTISVGAATSTLSTNGSAALLEQADKALYSSKSEGRNRVTHAMEFDGEVASQGPLAAVRCIR